MIRSLSDERIQSHLSSDHPYLIYAVPLLVETGQVSRFDSIIVVDIPVSMQLERLISRDDTTEEQARRIIESQASREQRLAIANDVIDNSKTKEFTVSQIKALHQQFSE